MAHVTVTIDTDNPAIAAAALRDAAEHIDRHGFISTRLVHRPARPGDWRNVGQLSCTPNWFPEHILR